MSDGDSDFVAEVEVNAIGQSCQYVRPSYWHRRPKSDQARTLIQSATATIRKRRCGSTVEARGRKLLRNPDNRSAGRPRGPDSQLAETGQQLAILRDCSWFVRNGSLPRGQMLTPSAFPGLQGNIFGGARFWGNIVPPMPALFRVTTEAPSCPASPASSLKPSANASIRRPNPTSGADRWRGYAGRTCGRAGSALSLH